jgi:signal transduction histidine kinase
MQDLNGTAHLLRPGAKSAIAVPLALEIKSVCQRQVEQTLDQLPILAAWIFYRSGQEERHSIGHCRPNRPGFDAITLSYLESEAWLDSELPRSVLLRLFYHQTSSAFSVSNGGNQRKRGIPEEVKDNWANWVGMAYIYILSQTETNDEYLLLWAARPLSWSQEKSIEQQAKILENYLISCQDRFRQQQEIELLEQAVRRGGHQLRNPLALIGLYAENLCLALPEGSFQDQAKIIRETAKDLGDNLESLLYCGKEAKIRVIVDDLRSILIESIKILQPKFDEKKLTMKYPDNSVNLAVDKWQIKQVFDTLLSNAIEFTPEGGTVTCDWRIFCNEVLVETRDQGIGLSAEDLKEAFTPFYSRRPGGLGLGLAIAKKVILDHKGSIWAQNLPGGGAQFSFTLPR